MQSDSAESWGYEQQSPRLALGSPSLQMEALAEVLVTCQWRLSPVAG